MKKFLLTFSLIFCCISLFSQQSEAFYQPLGNSLRPIYSDSLPDWVKMTFKSDVNFFEIEKAFEKDESSHSNDGEGESKLGNFYQRWHRAYEPFVQDDGSIKLPTYRAFQAQLQKENQETAKRSFLRSGAASWVNIGPKETHWLRDNNDAQPPCPWQVNVYAFDIAKSDPNILYCTTETGAVFKTTDKGLNWSVCGNGFNFGGAVTAIEIHPTNPNIVYLGASSNIFKTTDGGNTWTSIYDFNGLEPHDITISPLNFNTILVASEKGLLRSTDGGINWTRLYTTPCYDLEINPLSKNTILLLKNNGSYLEFLKSTDNGANFTVKTLNFTAGKTGRLAVTDANSNYIYALMTTASTSALLKSTDGGENWTSLNPTFCTGGISDATGGQGFYDLSIAASPTNADQILFGFCTLHKSTDGGVTATGVGGYCGTFNIHPDVQEVRAVNGDVWVATDGGFTLSTDFFTTSINAFARNNGIYATDFWGFSQGWNEDIMVGGRYHNGNTALADFYPAGKALRMGGAEAGTGYVLHGRSRSVVFSDLGDGWILPEKFDARSAGRFIYSKFPTEDGYGFDASELVIDPQYYKHNYLGKDTVLWKTIDGGSSFVRLTAFPTKIRRLEICRSNPNSLYLPTDGGLYKSLDKGNTFTRQTLPTGKSGFHAEISVSPTDENLLWLVFRNIDGIQLGKVYKSTNAGLNWTDMTTATLNDLQIKWVVFTGNTEGGVYIAAHENRGRVFYRDNTLNDWQDFSSNLPASMNIIRLLPFYRDAKLRVAGNRGIWETSLMNDKFKPLAQPTVDKQSSPCVRDTFYFDDYSIATHKGTTWKWTFSPAPQYVSSLTARNPKVVFGSSGSYSVTMTITDGNGNSDSKTYTNFVSVSNACSISPLAGNALELKTTTDYARTPAPNVTTNTMTLMAWIKPVGTQVDFAGILFSSSNGACGLNFITSNRLGYHWQDNVGTYTFIDGPIVPSDVWSHVALVVAPDSAVLYLNGVPYKRTAAHALVNFSSGFNIGNDRGNASRTFKGQIEEVCIYNKTLKTNEIRELMHLTHNPLLETGLLMYYQMNEPSGEILDKVGSKHATLSGTAGRVVSTAPVGEGTSFRLNVNSSGVKTFTGTGLTMTFAANATLPNGDVVVSRLNNQPDQKPNNSPASARYWVVNNFGVNQTISGLSGLTFDGFGAISANEAATPNLFKLYQRASTADGNTWGTRLGLANAATSGTSGTISYGLSNIISFGQFFITKEGSTAIKTPNGLDIEVLVYPNPSALNGMLNVKISREDNWEMSLFDVSGRLVKKENFRQNTVLSLSALAKGVYFYQIKSAYFMKFDKIVIE